MVSFACSRIGLTIFFYLSGACRQMLSFDSVGLSLELFIVYQFKRRLQMASPPHLMWPICHIFICVLQKKRKNTAQSHSTMRLFCHLLRLKEFHHVSDSNLPILRQFSKFHSDFFGDLRCFFFLCQKVICTDLQSGCKLL